MIDASIFFRHHVPVTFYLLFHLNSLVLVINSSINFVICYCVGKDFRKQTKIMLQEIKENCVTSLKFFGRNWLLYLNCIKMIYYFLRRKTHDSIRQFLSSDEILLLNLEHQWKITLKISTRYYYVFVVAQNLLHRVWKRTSI